MRNNGGSDPGSEAGSPSVRDDDGGSGIPALKLRLLAGAIAAVVVIVDQLTKAWAVRTLDDGPIVLIDGVLNLRLFFNTGASFSLFAKGGAIIGLVVIGVVVMIFFALREAGHRLDAVALGLVLGGAIGNLLDRLFRGDGFLDGAVVDFINVPFFATFNVADIAINIGVGLLLVGAFLRR
ncbi:MAG: signal peptidase II [Actinomycetota bacterium]|nr:signal peptidase II [Actinomycetota bacterium]